MTLLAQVQLVSSLVSATNTDRPLLVVDCLASAEQALVSAAHGTNLVIDLRLVGRERERFLDDLGRVAVLEPTAGRAVGPLPEPHLALLLALGEGRVLSQVARELGMSRRTASRRPAEARELLGVATNMQAVLAAPRPESPRLSGNE